MSIPYDLFAGTFLSKISEYEFSKLWEEDRTQIVDGYLKRAVSNFRKDCSYDLSAAANDNERQYDIDIESDDLDELLEIISEGMIVQWLKPYVYQQENLQNVLNTRDYSTYSPAELLLRIGNAYAKAQKDYIQMIRDYSYNHGDLLDLHL